MTAPASLTYSAPVARVALVSLTVTARAIVFTDARCPNCRRLVMAVPGTPAIEVRAVAHNDQRSGRGRVVSCQRCRTLCEVVEHR